MGKVDADFNRAHPVESRNGMRDSKRRRSCGAAEIDLRQTQFAYMVGQAGVGFGEVAGGVREGAYLPKQQGQRK